MPLGAPGWRGGIIGAIPPGGGPAEGGPAIILPGIGWPGPIGPVCPGWCGAMGWCPMGG